MTRRLALCLALLALDPAPAPSRAGTAKAGGSAAADPVSR